jgi:4-amino-4-deoxy-L-arabinose transferase-like glycosyltransferase
MGKCIDSAQSPAHLLADRYLTTALLALGLTQIFIWGIAAWYAYSSIELDSAEQLVWGKTLQWGYWKHPPLPSWIMHGASGLVTPSVALPLVMAQAAIVTALALSWRLAREVLPPRLAALSVLLTSLVLYHNAGADSFNHNTVLLPFQAATTLACYLAARRGSLRWWAATGLFAGLSILVKYVAITHIVGLLLYLLLDRSVHHRRTLAGLLLSAMVFTLVISPHFYWLYANHFPPMQYARSVMLPLAGTASALASVAAFLEVQCYRLVPLLPLLLLVARRRRRAGSVPGKLMSKPDRLFVWLNSLAPLLITILFSLASGSKLEARWGANAFLLAGLLAMVVLRPVVTAGLLRNVMALTVSVHLVLCLGLVLSKSVIADHLGRRTRANFPAAELAWVTEQTWRAHTGVPLRIVATDIWLGGNIRASGLPGVSVLIDGDYAKSPWIRPEDVYACGAIVLDDAITERRAGNADRQPLQALLANAAASGTFPLTWGGNEYERRTVRWAYLPPHDQARCAM